MTEQKPKTLIEDLFYLYSLPSRRSAAFTKNAGLSEDNTYFGSLFPILPPYLLEEGLPSHPSERARAQQDCQRLKLRSPIALLSAMKDISITPGKLSLNSPEFCLNTHDNATTKCSLKELDILDFYPRRMVQQDLDTYTGQKNIPFCYPPVWSHACDLEWKTGDCPFLNVSASPSSLCNRRETILLFLCYVLFWGEYCFSYPLRLVSHL